MSHFKALIFCKQTKVFLKTQNPLYKGLLPPPPFAIRAFNSSLAKPTKKPLSQLFRQAVDLSEKTGGNESQGEIEGEDNGLIRGLRELEREFRKLKESPKGEMKGREGGKKEKPEKVKSLVEVFGGAKKEEQVEKELKVRSQEEEIRVLGDLSPVAEKFVRHLYAKGYFNKTSFLKGNKLDFGYFDKDYSRNFIKFAASKFGKDHQEIAKWLSGKHLKKVLLLGCPSIDKNNVYAAKRMRKFMKIEESTVCHQCKLKDSCKFANKNIYGHTTKNLHLVDVMKVIAVYVLDQVPPTLTVPNEVKDSASRLLMEAIKLSKSI